MILNLWSAAEEGTEGRGKVLKIFINIACIYYLALKTSVLYLLLV